MIWMGMRTACARLPLSARAAYHAAAALGPARRRSHGRSQPARDEDEGTHPTGGPMEAHTHTHTHTHCACPCAVQYARACGGRCACSGRHRRRHESCHPRTRSPYAGAAAPQATFHRDAASIETPPQSRGTSYSTFVRGLVHISLPGLMPSFFVCTPPSRGRKTRSPPRVRIE